MAFRKGRMNSTHRASFPCHSLNNRMQIDSPEAFCSGIYTKGILNQGLLRLHASTISLFLPLAVNLLSLLLTSYDNFQRHLAVCMKYKIQEFASPFSCSAKQFYALSALMAQEVGKGESLQCHPLCSRCYTIIWIENCWIEIGSLSMQQIRVGNFSECFPCDECSKQSVNSGEPLIINSARNVLL